MSGLVLFLLALVTHAAAWAAPAAPVAPLEVNPFDVNTPGGGLGVDGQARRKGEQRGEAPRKLPGSDVIVETPGPQGSTDRQPPAQNPDEVRDSPPSPRLPSGSPAQSYRDLEPSVGKRTVPGFSSPAGEHENGRPVDPRGYLLVGLKQPASAYTNLQELDDGLNVQVPVLARSPANLSGANNEETGSNQGRENLPHLPDRKVSSEFFQQHTGLGVNAVPEGRAKPSHQGRVPPTPLKNSIFRELIKSIPPVPANPASRAGGHQVNISLGDVDELSRGLFRSGHSPPAWSGPPGGAGRDAQGPSSPFAVPRQENPANFEKPRASRSNYQNRDISTSHNTEQLDVLQSPYEIRQPQNSYGVYSSQNPFPGYLMQKTGYPHRPAYITSPEFSQVPSYKDSYPRDSGNLYLEQNYRPIFRPFTRDSTNTGFLSPNPRNEDKATIPDGEHFSLTPNLDIDRPEPSTNVSRSDEFVRQKGQHAGARDQHTPGLSLADRRLSLDSPYSFLENDDFLPGAGQTRENGYRQGQGENGYRQGQGENGYRQGQEGQSRYRHEQGQGENGYRQGQGQGENGYRQGQGENGYRQGQGENGYRQGQGQGENGYRQGQGQGENGYRQGQGENGYRQGQGQGENGYRQGQEERSPNRPLPSLDNVAVARQRTSALHTAHYSEPYTESAGYHQSSRRPPLMQNAESYRSSQYDAPDENDDLDLRSADRRPEILLNVDSRRHSVPSSSHPVSSGALTSHDTLDLRLGYKAGSRDNSVVYPAFGMGSRDNVADDRRHEPFVSDENPFTGLGSRSYELPAPPRAGYISARDTQHDVRTGPGALGADGGRYSPQGAGDVAYTIPRAGAGVKGSEFAATRGRVHFAPNGERLPQTDSYSPQVDLRFALRPQNKMDGDYPNEVEGRAFPRARYFTGRSSSPDGDSAGSYGKVFNKPVLPAPRPAPQDENSPRRGPEVGVAVVKGGGTLTDPILSRRDLGEAAHGRTDKSDNPSQQPAATRAPFPEGTAIFLGKLPASALVSP